MLKCHEPYIRNDSKCILYIISACERLQHIEDLDGVNTKGRHNIKEDSGGCKKCQTSVILTDRMETLAQATVGNHERSVLGEVRKEAL